FPTVSLTGSATVAEGNTTNLTFTRNDTTNALDVSVTMPATNTAGEGTDYTLTGAAISGVVTPAGFTVHFNAGQAVATVTFNATNDGGSAEADELAHFDLATSANYAINAATSSVDVTIQANGTVVTNTATTGEGSLQQAIINANNGLGPIVSF